MAAQAGLCLAGSPEDTFCPVVGHLFDYLKEREMIKSIIQKLYQNSWTDIVCIKLKKKVNNSKGSDENMDSHRLL